MTPDALRLLVPATALVLSLALLGCAHGGSVTVGNGEPHARRGPGHGHGPPPHAPAHGYRAKHGPGDSVQLVFDSRLGVYVVVDLPDHYFWDGFYLRVEDGRWYASVSLDGGWEPRSVKSLPPGLRKKVARGKGKGRGPGPAKGRW
jgi:hypothetical protein